MKIVELRAENIKKLKAIEIRPTDSTIEITGKNGQGKTSVLDCILYALAGEKNIPEKIIREGEERGEINLDLDEYVIKRVITQKGSRLEVMTKEGASFKSPQSILDNITGKLSFDPLGFVNMDKKQKFETLKQLTGLDTSEIDKKREEVFNKRTDVNREVKRYEAIVGEDKDYSQVPDVEISAIDLIKEIQDIKDHNNKLANVNIEVTNLKSMVDKLEKQLIDAKEFLTNKSRELAKLSEVKVADLSQLNVKLSTLEDTNKKVREKKAYNENYEKMTNYRQEWEKLTNQIKEFDDKKQELLKAVKMPVDGLLFDENGITVNGLMFDNLNDAEKLKISLAIAMACNPVLKVIRITNGSLLDSANLKIIKDMVKDKDYQLWLERVDETGKVGIIIEDGEIKNA